jgi:hypothetical protein
MAGMSSFKTAPSDFQSKPLGFTAEERAYREKRQVWMDRVQWRLVKGCGDPRHTREFYRIYDAMLASGDVTELTAWINAYNRGEK